MIKLNSYLTIQDCIKSLLPSLTSEINELIQEKDHCVVALAGGSTPKPLYQALSKVQLPWSKISITLTDERWVNREHKDSNEKMIRDTLFQTLTDQPRFIPLINEESTAQAGAIAVNDILTESIPSLDVVILGMGEDGHFASIFPRVNNLNALLSPDSLENCLAVLPPGKQERISLTYAYLTRAKTIYLLVSGEEKKKIIDGVLNGEDVYKAFPIWQLLNQSLCPVKIYWNA